MRASDGLAYLAVSYRPVRASTRKGDWLPPKGTGLTTVRRRGDGHLGGAVFQFAGALELGRQSQPERGDSVGRITAAQDVVGSGQGSGEDLVAAGFVCGTWNPDTAVGDVLVRAGIETRSQESQGFDEFPGLRAAHAFRERDVEVASAAGGVVRDVADTAAFQEGPEASGIVIDDALQRFGSVQVKAESGHGAVCSVNGDSRRPCWHAKQ